MDSAYIVYCFNRLPLGPTLTPEECMGRVMDRYPVISKEEYEEIMADLRTETRDDS